MSMYKKVMIAWAVVMSMMASRVAAADVTATTVAVGDSIMTLSQVVATGLPVLCVETVEHEEPTCDYVSAPAGCMGLGISNATKVPGRLTVYQRIGGVDSLMYDSGDYEKDVSGMTIKIRGNSSAYYDKKPYKIKLQKKRDLLFRGNESMYKDKNWVLLRDEMLRTMAAFKVSRLVGMVWTPGCRYVNVVLNGVYRGVYLLCESVERNPDCRLNVDKNTGFIFECDPYWWNEGVYVTSTHSPSYNYTFKYPDEDEITPQQLAYMQGLVATYEASLTTPDYPQLIDVTSFAAWCLVHDIEGSKDEAGANRYYTKYDTTSASKIMMPMVWDFDMSERTPSEWSRCHSVHMSILFNNPNRTYVNEFVRLWCQIRDHFVDDITSSMNAFETADEGVALKAANKLELIKTGSNYPVDRYVWWRNKWFTERYPWLDAAIMAMHVPHDVDVDGSVGISDVVALVDMMLGNAPTMSIGDINGDGIVGIDDVSDLIDELLAGD